MADTAANIDSPHEGLTTGERLGLLRRRSRKTLRVLAAETGLSHSALSSYERDEVAPSGEAIRRLALALGSSTDYLLRLKTKPSYLRGKRTTAPPTEPVQSPLVAPVPTARPGRP